MYGAQALEFRRPQKFSLLVEKNFEIIREKVPKLEEDRILKDDINNMIELVKNNRFIVE